jgi:hypothetical protein
VALASEALEVSDFGLSVWCRVPAEEAAEEPF